MTDECGISSNADIVSIYCREERAELKGKAHNIQLNLFPKPYIWPQALGSDRDIQVADTSGRYELPPYSLLGGD